MKLWGRGEDEKKEARAFRHDVVTSHTQGRAAASMGSKQMIDSLGRAYFLQEDENVVNDLKEYCPELLPAFSRLNATSRINKPRDRRLIELRLDDILLHKEMELGDEANTQQLNFIKSLRVYGGFRIFDAIDGYRGKLVTEEIERHTHVIEEPKKKPLL